MHTIYNGNDFHFLHWAEAGDSLRRVRMWATTGCGGRRVRIAEITSEIEFDIGALRTKKERLPRTIV